MGLFLETYDNPPGEIVLDLSISTPLMIRCTARPEGCFFQGYCYRIGSCFWSDCRPINWPVEIDACSNKIVIRQDDGAVAVRASYLLQALRRRLHACQRGPANGTWVSLRRITKQLICSRSLRIGPKRRNLC